MKIAMYLRLSEEDRDMAKSKKKESDSISSQRNLILDFIGRNVELQKAEILEFSDDGFSGKNFERPGLERMLRMAKQGDIQCIVVKDLSRFGRDYLTAGNYICRIFPFMGVRFISVNDGFDSACRQDTESLDAAFKMLLHDLYSRDLSRKVRSAQYLRAERGEFLSSFAPFGYVRDEKDRKKLAVDTAAAEIVRRIFRLALDGVGTARIAGILNREEVPTPMAYKRAAGCTRKRWGRSGETNFWTPGTVGRILRDERYIGSSIYGKKRRERTGYSREKEVPKEEWIVVENTHERLVTKEAFDAIQKKIQRTARRPGGNSGICAHAGRNSEKDRCGIWEEAGRIREEKDRPQGTDSPDNGKRAVRLKKSLGDAESRLQALYGQLVLGEITKKEYLAGKEAILRKKEVLTRQLAERTNLVI